MSKYRFKTKDEFIRDGRWDDDYNTPLMWAASGIMDSFLGKDIPESLNKECDEGSALKIDGWGFSSEDYILKEGNEINTNGFEYFGDTLMGVSNDGERWFKRVVFGKKNNEYIAWAGLDCYTLEGVRAENGTFLWKYAKPIKIKLTLKEIADKFGLDVNEIEII